MKLNKIYNENCLTGMKKIEDGIVDCCVTSPPYWGLRDYGIEPTYWPEIYYSPMPGVSEIYIPEWTGCLGLEPTIEMFIGHIVLVFREVKRVLNDSGTAWVNFGDSYIGTGGNRNKPVSREIFNTQQNHNPKGDRYERIKGAKENGLKTKDLAGIPWRVAFALQADGWYLRSDIIWHKLSCMPEAVKDRPTKNHEYIFLLAKSNRYYYDYEAILEPIAASTINRLQQDIENQSGSKRANGGAKINGPMKAVIGKGNSKSFRGGGAYTKNQSFNNSVKIERETQGNAPNETGLRNKRTVWSIGPQPFKEAHFATFPLKLIEPCILAGCPVSGIVLDPFMGSGTTAEKAIELQRNFIGFEINSNYKKLAENKRLKDVQLKIV